MVDILVHVYLADEVPVLADRGKQFEHPFDNGQEHRFSDLVELTPRFPDRMVDLYPLFDCLQLEKEQIENIPLKEFSRDKSLVDIDDFFVVVEHGINEIKYF